MSEGARPATPGSTEVTDIRAHGWARFRHPLLCVAAATVFIWAGVGHFRSIDFYTRIVPPMFPAARRLVQISGVCEIAGGLGLLIRPLRPIAGRGLLALLLAVFPANVYMALNPGGTPTSFPFPLWARWLRLPLQAVLALWVWKAAELDRRGRHWQRNGP